MPSYNKVQLIGNLTRDPEMRYLANGTPVASFSLAINRNWTDKESGQKKAEVTFVDCEAWGRTAETICQFMKKGLPMLVEGRLKQESWEDKSTGQKRTKMKVVAEHTVFLGSPQDGEGDGSPASTQRFRPAATASQQARGQAAAETAQPDPDDDVPF